jgi:hypothetical protein
VKTVSSEGQRVAPNNSISHVQSNEIEKLVRRFFKFLLRTGIAILVHHQVCRHDAAMMLP